MNEKFLKQSHRRPGRGRERPRRTRTRRVTLTARRGTHRRTPVSTRRLTQRTYAPGSGTAVYASTAVAKFSAFWFSTVYALPYRLPSYIHAKLYQKKLGCMWAACGCGGLHTWLHTISITARHPIIVDVVSPVCVRARWADNGGCSSPLCESGGRTCHNLLHVLKGKLPRRRASALAFKHPGATVTPPRWRQHVKSSTRSNGACVGWRERGWGICPTAHGGSA
jgi:hypothetical protein